MRRSAVGLRQICAAVAVLLVGCGGGKAVVDAGSGSVGQATDARRQPTLLQCEPDDPIYGGSASLQADFPGWVSPEEALVEFRRQQYALRRSMERPPTGAATAGEATEAGPADIRYGKRPEDAGRVRFVRTDGDGTVRVEISVIATAGRRGWIAEGFQACSKWLERNGGL